MLFSISTIASIAVAFLICPTLARKASNQTNVVFVLSDDQDARMDSLSHMQQVQNLLIDQGTQFTKHYAHVALCCPSRVTLWTGQHAHNTNVTDVGTPYGGWPKVQNVGLWNKYLPVWLNENGVNTYYSGKLYNAHSVNNYDREGKYAAGWTESDFLLEPSVYTYYNSQFQHNKGNQHDGPEEVIGYSTDLITNYTLGYIDDAIKANKPFFVVAAPIAPHVAITHPKTGHPIPEKKYDGKFPDLKVPKTPNFNPNQSSGVLHIKDLAQITDPKYLDYLDTFYQKRIEALQSVDDMVAQVIKKLEYEGILDNTYIIYSSDNGYHIGQHRMAPGKKCAFEEDINVPMIIRGPKVAKGKKTDMVTSHVDLSPTIMNIFGLKSEPEKHSFDGQGLEFPLLSQGDFDNAKKSRGEHVNVEMWGSYQQEGFNQPEIHAIQTYKSLRIQGSGYNFMYSVWCNESAHEFYEMISDEYQMNNLHPGRLTTAADNSQLTLGHLATSAKDENQLILGRPLAQVLNRLDAVLLVQKSCTKSQCRKPWDHLHPGGQVRNLTDALDEKYDRQYAKYEKVGFTHCFMEPVYHPWAEGPQWNGTQQQGQANSLMRYGLDWDTWA